MKLNERGLLIVISGPSGVGKSSVRKALFDMPGQDLVYSVSMTTRKPRNDETEGLDYYFVNKKTFEDKIKNGEFLEWANFVGYYYGTPKDKIEELLDEGKQVVLEIEVDGALQVRRQMKDAVFIFLVPPAKESLINRLKSRGTEDESELKERIDKAEKEYLLAYKYDYIVVNDEVNNAADRIMAIIRAEHARTERTIHKYLELMEGEKDEK